MLKRLESEDRIYSDRRRQNLESRRVVPEEEPKTEVTAPGHTGWKASVGKFLSSIAAFFGYGK
jgi:hypothetical protein